MLRVISCIGRRLSRALGSSSEDIAAPTHHLTQGEIDVLFAGTSPHHLHRFPKELSVSPAVVDAYRRKLFDWARLHILEQFAQWQGAPLTTADYEQLLEKCMYAGAWENFFRVKEKLGQEADLRELKILMAGICALGFKELGGDEIKEGRIEDAISAARRINTPEVSDLLIEKLMSLQQWRHASTAAVFCGTAGVREKLLWKLFEVSPGAATRHILTDLWLIPEDAEGEVEKLVAHNVKHGWLESAAQLAQFIGQNLTMKDFEIIAAERLANGDVKEASEAVLRAGRYLNRQEVEAAVEVLRTKSVAVYHDKFLELGKIRITPDPDSTEAECYYELPPAVVEELVKGAIAQHEPGLAVSFSLLRKPAQSEVEAK